MLILPEVLPRYRRRYHPPVYETIIVAAVVTFIVSSRTFTILKAVAKMITDLQALRLAPIVDPPLLRVFLQQSSRSGSQRSGAGSPGWICQD